MSIVRSTNRVSRHLSDRFGRKRMYIIGIAAIAIFTFVYFALLNTAIPGVVFVAIILAAEAQERAMAAAAEAARQSADIARRALTVLERPYIVVDVTEPGIQVDASGQFSFVGPQPRWEAFNHGRSPSLAAASQLSASPIPFSMRTPG